MTKAQLNAFLAAFKLTSTGDTADVGSSDVKRKLLVHYIKKEGDAAYEMLGYKQESLSTSSNYDTSDKTDVTGATYTDVGTKAEKIEMSEYHINPSATKFLEEAIKLKLSDQEEEMQNYSILTVYGFLRNGDGACLATEETGCTLLLDNLGGQGFTTNDVNITLSGIKKYGTVAEITKSPTFTEAQAAA